MSATSVKYEIAFRKYIEKERINIFLHKDNTLTKKEVDDLARKFCLSFFKAVEVISDNHIVVK